MNSKLSYQLTEEEKEILAKAEFIKLRVFLYEFGKAIGAEILLQEDDTVLVDGEKLDADQFEVYLDKITGGMSISAFLKETAFGDDGVDETDDYDWKDDDDTPYRYDA